MYDNSQMYGLLKAFSTGTKTNFKYSFLGKITEMDIDRECNAVILDNSKLAKCLLNSYNTWKLKIMDYVRTNATIGLVVAVRRVIYFSPVKTISIAAVVVILINFIFSVLLNKDIVLMSWIIQGMLLFMGLAGLFCEADLKNLTGTSLFLKWINHSKQSEAGGK